MEEKRGESSSSTDKPNIGSKKLLGDLTQKKISYYFSKNTLSDAELYSVVKDFFGEFLDIKTEYTFAELLEEINKTYFEQNVKDKLIDYIKKIQVIEYKSNAYPEEEIRKLLTEFSNIVSAILRTSKVKPKTGFSTMVKSIFAKKKTTSEQSKSEPELSTEEIMERLEDITAERFHAKTENQPEAPPSPDQEKVEEEKKEQEKEEIQKAIESLNAEDILPEEKDNTNWTEPREEKITESQANTDWTKEIDAITTTKTEKPTVPEKKPKTSPKKKAKQNKELLALIKKSKRLRKKETLKTTYHEINKIYESLSNEDKHQYYDDVHGLYDKLKKMKNKS